MTEQELLDMFIQERINMLLSNLSKNRPKKTSEENERILQAEKIIDKLSDENEKWCKTTSIILRIYSLQMSHIFIFTAILMV